MCCCIFVAFCCSICAPCRRLWFVIFRFSHAHKSWAKNVAFLRHKTPGWAAHWARAEPIRTNRWKRLVQNYRFAWSVILFRHSCCLVNLISANIPTLWYQTHLSVFQLSKHAQFAKHWIAGSFCIMVSVRRPKHLETMHNPKKTCLNESWKIALLRLNKIPKNLLL